MLQEKDVFFTLIQETKETKGIIIGEILNTTYVVIIPEGK
jgi:hypothetical protein